MSHQSSGGTADLTGAAFELRLGVEFCTYMLVGDAAGLGPGAVSLVQPQAPKTVDDLVVHFESGAKWAIQAKAGQVNVSWKPSSRFGEALRQLYQGATQKQKQVDLSPGSLDRLELAVDDQAAATVGAFERWLEKARRHVTWAGLAEACTNAEERACVQELPKLLGISPDDGLLAFLKKLHVRRLEPLDLWRQRLRSLLVVAGVPEAASAERVLDVLRLRVQEAAPQRGQLTRDDLLRACEARGIEGLPGFTSRLAASFRVVERPEEDTLRPLVNLNPIPLRRFVERPELAEALASGQGALIVGKPGIGKSAALIHLALAQPALPVVVVQRGFRAEDVTKLLLRRAAGPYQLIWDDIHLKPDLFADAVEKLLERGDQVRVLCACRADGKARVGEKVAPDFWRRAGLQTQVQLLEFQPDQAAQLCDAVASVLELDLDDEARRRFAQHVVRGDGGPLFAVATGLLLRERAGRRVRAGDVGGLPGDLVQVWQDLYRRLEDRPHAQSLLHCLHFLHGIGCPLNVRLAELLYTQALRCSPAEFLPAAETLARGLWLRREGDDFASHDVSLEAVPDSPERFQVFVSFAQAGCEGEDLALGLLRGSLSLYRQERIPFTTNRDSRELLAGQAVELGRRAIENFRAIGHLPYLGSALSNTSNALSELAGLETTREGRARLLQQAIAYVEEAIRIRRELGLQANVATSLNNASNRYSELAGLETTREGRARLLQQAIAYVEEAITLYRELGLQADIAMSLGTANICYRAMAGTVESAETQLRFLRMALECIEEAVAIFRALGIVRYLVMALYHAVISHLALAEKAGGLDAACVRALCAEGEALAAAMGEEETKTFFQDVQRGLAQEQTRNI